MGNPLPTQEKDQSPFKFLSDMDINPTDSPDDKSGAADDKGAEGDQKSADDGKEKVSITKKEYQDLMAKVNKATSTPGMDDEKMKQVMENNKIVDAIKQAILPNEGEVKASELRKQEDAFDTAPVDFITQKIREEIKGLEERQTKSEIKAFATDVMMNIDKEYVVDWEKEGNKVAAELALMDPAFKHRDPRGATLKAMQLAGVGKKRPAPVQFPFFESSNYSTAEQRQKAMETEGDAYKKSIFAYAKKMTKSPLDGFLGK